MRKTSTKTRGLHPSWHRAIAEGSVGRDFVMFGADTRSEEERKIQIAIQENIRRIGIENRIHAKAHENLRAMKGSDKWTQEEQRKNFHKEWKKEMNKAVKAGMFK